LLNMLEIYNPENCQRFRISLKPQRHNDRE
jgi:hypothetical protein